MTSRQTLVFLAAVLILNMAHANNSEIEIPNCFGSLNQNGVYVIQFKQESNPINKLNTLRFLQATAFIVDQYHLRQNIAILVEKTGASSFKATQDAMAALRVATKYRTIQKISCKGFAKIQ